MNRLPLFLRMAMLGSLSALPVHAQEPPQPEPADDPMLLFEDPMTDNWQESWFLDGTHATVAHRDGGLYFAAGTVTKSMDPEEYHAHHAALWTRQEFEGDLRIRYEMTRVDDSDYGTTLLYIQARGTGAPPHAEDLTEWNALREIPAMATYFDHMNLLSLSFRENLRCKRYPWLDKELYDGPRGLIPPMVDYNGEGIQPGHTYRVEVEKRANSLRLKLVDTAGGRVLIDHTWDTTRIPDAIEPKVIRKGRIGLRHMSTRQFVYRDFRVERLAAAEEN